MFKHLSFFLILFTWYHSPAQSLSSQLIKSGFTNPVDVTNCNDGSDRLFVVEQAGIIKIVYKNRQLPATVFLDMRSKVSSGGEKGLLGLAFHPDYKNNGYFYVNYTTSNATRIARYQVSSTDPNAADLASEKILKSIGQPYSNHNGGCLKFNPVDGYLYVGMGDGGSGGDPQCFAQNPLSYLGKMLRLDVNQNMEVSPYYGIPADNPYINNPAFYPEIWAIGLRNPWRFSFDRQNGDLWVGDVGQGDREEINHIVQGSGQAINFGWKVMEGNFCYDNTNCGTNQTPCNDAAFTSPFFDYGRSSSTGGFSVTGGFVYRGCDFENLKGKYIFADYGTGNAWVNTSLHTTLKTTVTNISAFGEDEAGELYCVSLSSDALYRITDSSVLLKKTLTGNINASEYAVDSLLVQAPVTFVGDTLRLTSRNILWNGVQEIGLNKTLKMVYTGGCN